MSAEYDARRRSATRARVDQAESLMAQGLTMREAAEAMGWTYDRLKAARRTMGLARPAMTREEIGVAHGIAWTRGLRAAVEATGRSKAGLLLAFKRHGLPMIATSPHASAIRSAARLTIPAERRRAIAMKGNAAVSPEKRRETLRRVLANMTPCQRRLAAVKSGMARSVRAESGPDRWAQKWERRVRELVATGLPEDSAQERATAELSRRLA